MPKITKNKPFEKVSKPNQKNKFTKDTTLEKVMKVKGAEKVLHEFGVPCMTCPMAQAEMPYLKIGDVCATYRIDLAGLLGKLNGLV